MREHGTWLRRLVWRRSVAALTVTATTLMGSLLACSGVDDSDLPETDGEAGTDASTTVRPDGAPLGDGGGSEAGPITAREACEAYLNAACTRYAECGQPLNCDNYLAYCPDYLFAQGSSRQVDDVLACAVVRRNQDCAEVLLGIDPPCATPGTGKKGDACDFNGQCESFRCTGFAACGTCLGLTPPNSGCPKAGDACGHNQTCPSEDAGCVLRTAPPHLAPGDVCPQPDGGGLACPPDAPCLGAGAKADVGTCTVPPKSGPCAYPIGAAQAGSCAYGTQCVREDASAPNGLCAPGAQLGETCGGAAQIACVDGLYCASGKCAPRLQVGAACTGVGECAVGAYCKLTAPSVGTCEPAAAPGAPCGASAADAGLVPTPCAQGSCGAISTDAGIVHLCVNAAAHQLDPCAPPLSPCFGALECGPDKICHLPACVLDAGTD